MNRKLKRIRKRGPVLLSTFSEYVSLMNFTTDNCPVCKMLREDFIKEHPDFNFQEADLKIAKYKLLKHVN